jgi:hypothetical protein
VTQIDTVFVGLIASERRELLSPAEVGEGDPLRRRPRSRPAFKPSGVNGDFGAIGHER